MKNSKIKYLLILLVACIWGLIVYRIIAYKSADFVTGKADIGLGMEISKSTRDTFSLQLNYPNPFQGQRDENKSAHKAAKSKTTEVKVREIQKNSNPAIVWPNIKYKGVVLNNNRSNISIILIINGNSYILKKGDEVQGLKVISICKDSVGLNISNQNKYFKIHEN